MSDLRDPPLDYWRRTYGFEATQEWLDEVRLASVRYGNVCSASFVSPDGLVMTNHHCARGCIEAVSTARERLPDRRFPRWDRGSEAVCPKLYLDQLVGVDNVTSPRPDGGAEGGSDEEIAAAQEAVRERIAEECEAAGELRCQVVPLFHGGQFWLYRYRRYEAGQARLRA